MTPRRRRDIAQGHLLGPAQEPPPAAPKSAGEGIAPPQGLVRARYYLHQGEARVPLCCSRRTSRAAGRRRRRGSADRRVRARAPCSPCGSRSMYRLTAWAIDASLQSGVTRGAAADVSAGIRRGTSVALLPSPCGAGGARPRMCSLGRREGATTFASETWACASRAASSRAASTELYRELEGRGLVSVPTSGSPTSGFCPGRRAGASHPLLPAPPSPGQAGDGAMGEVEGGSPRGDLKILRHETGHAIENPTGLRRRHRRRSCSGGPQEPYPDAYAPRPYRETSCATSKPGTRRAIPTRTSPRPSRFAHPGVRLAAALRARPAPAQAGVRGQGHRTDRPQPPLETSRQRTDALSSSPQTCARTTRRGAGITGIRPSAVVRPRMERLFSRPEHAQRPRPGAASRVRKPVGARVSSWTGQRQYVVDGVLKACWRAATSCVEAGGLRRRGEREFSVLLACLGDEPGAQRGHRVPL